MKKNFTKLSLYLISFILILCMSFFCISCSTAGSTKATEFDAATQARLETAVNDHMTVEGVEIPGAVVGIWTPDRGTWVKAFGVADISTQRPMRTTDHFRIASITKTFTADIILQLKDEQELTLEDTLASHGFTDVPNADIITIRHLLNMSSGLYDYSEDEVFGEQVSEDYTAAWTPQELLEFIIYKGVRFPPGQEYRYTNTNYILLGLIIEKVTGNTYETELNNRILEPLGLTNTAYPDGPYLNDKFPSGYQVTVIDGSPTLTDITTFHPSQAWTAGGMTSNLEDMRKWAVEMSRGSLLQQETQEERMNWENLDFGREYLRYCLGSYWLGENILFGHTGSIPGFSSAAFHMPNRQATFVVLANTNFMYTNDIIKALAKVVYPDDVEW
jgi:D-alanyl-D-alanine carboxypeptidase